MACTPKGAELLARSRRDDPLKLHISMLGGCNLVFGARSISDQIIRSKKPWLLLEYLIAFRDRELSQNELIEAVYPEGKSENPVGALKTLIHRVRFMLADLQFGDSKDLILQSRGSYKWNNDLPFDTDIDLFDALFDHAFAVSDVGERLDCLLAAAHLYEGDFLPKSSTESWVVQLSAYYHSRYIEVVRNVCELLRAKSRFDEITTLCYAAIRIDAYEESFYYHLIRALIDLGRHQTALTVYKDMNNLFYREFGVTPSEMLISLYRDIIKSIHMVETDLGVIRAKLREDEDLDGAYLCEYEIFKDIYRLEVRTAARSGESIFLCLLTLDGGESSMSSKALSANMDKLSESIRISLRRGDVYTKYSVSQFLMLLPSLTYENCETVLSRITRRYKKAAPMSPLRPTFSIQPIDMKLT